MTERGTKRGNPAKDMTDENEKMDACDVCSWMDAERFCL